MLHRKGGGYVSQVFDVTRSFITDCVFLVLCGRTLDKKRQVDNSSLYATSRV